MLQYHGNWFKKKRKKAGDGLIVFIHGSVQQCLKAPTRSWAPAHGITTTSDQSGCDVLQIICQREPQWGVPLLIWHGRVSSSGAYGICDKGKLISDGQLKSRLPILSPDVYVRLVLQEKERVLAVLPLHGHVQQGLPV